MFEEREEEVEQQAYPQELELSVDALVDKFGFSKLYDVIARKATMT
jgi:hypothetical protein